MEETENEQERERERENGRSDWSSPLSAASAEDSVRNCVVSPRRPRGKIYPLREILCRPLMPDAPGEEEGEKTSS